MLTGKLVTLRPLTAEDYPRLTEFKNDIELQLLGDGSPPVPSTLAAVTELQDRRAQAGDNYSFAIDVDGDLIGDIGLFNLNRVSRLAEVGIGIGDRNYLGKGYGREAMALILDYGFRIQNFRKIWLETFAHNERAIRSYLAVGFVEEGRYREHSWVGGTYVDLVVMGLLRREWAGLPS
ncbi:MAG: Acetyltransferase including N-acetylase of ribosomal protein [Frankiales bacterium]|nr:Acetyltransferase including N-acetylase of ribosomal protein [Frankiales bacterium]